ATQRQQTLKRTLDWSYDLLLEAEKGVFRQLPVFAGGWTLEAAEAVCGVRNSELEARGSPSAPDFELPSSNLELGVLEGLVGLVDKSLVRQVEAPPSEPCFSMLETIREYALERLEESGEADTLRRRHAAFYLELAVEASGFVGGLFADEAPPLSELGEQVAWLDRLQREHDNFRTALRWLDERGDVEQGLRLAELLAWFWYIRGYWREGPAWLERLLVRSPGAAPATRAKALRILGYSPWHGGDYRRAAARLEESLRLYRELGDPHGTTDALLTWGFLEVTTDHHQAAAGLLDEALALSRERGYSRGTAWALICLGHVVARRGDDRRAATLYQEGLALHRQRGDTNAAATTLRFLGQTALRQGHLDRAEALFEESLAVDRALGTKEDVALTLHALGRVARLQTDFPRATALLEESLALFRELGTVPAMAMPLETLGRVAQDQGDSARAAALLQESLIVYRRAGLPSGMARCLVALAGVLVATGQAERAAQLLGAAEALFASGAPLDPTIPADCARLESTIRAALGDKSLAAARAEGRALPLEQAIEGAIEYALALTAPALDDSSATSAPAAVLSPLTRHEREVAALVTRGLTNREIAADLVITERTAASHVEHILAKLGLRSRAQIAAWAAARDRRVPEVP
ncbi:MAG: helix-turn-helix transcriptional regulator, partial [Chloroflexota bacterium]